LEIEAVAGLEVKVLFFFEKKNQKTLASFSARCGNTRQQNLAHPAPALCFRAHVIRRLTALCRIMP